MATVELVPAATLPPEAYPRFCQALAARDPLTFPAWLGPPPVLAAVHGEAVVGVGAQTQATLDVRVLPSYRRRGLGQALLTQLNGTEGWLDAGHASAKRFALAAGFQMQGARFHQRWDGELADVAPAFATATVESAPALVGALLACPPPLAPQVGLLARRDGAPVGALIAEPKGDLLWLNAVLVVPEARGLGVGRRLLTALMTEAAGRGLGVGLALDTAEEALLARTAQLGFWSFRTCLKVTRA